MKINRKDFAFSDHKQIEQDDIEYWSHAPIKEKLQMITYLRECFYGKKATTGRLQRIFRFVKQKQS